MIQRSAKWARCGRRIATIAGARQLAFRSVLQINATKLLRPFNQKKQFLKKVGIQPNVKLAQSGRTSAKLVGATKVVQFVL
jgi:hypothetical protein